jgi:lipoyl(octanoyl) transferase
MNQTLAIAWLGTVDYERALRLQEAMAAARQSEAIGDVLLLLEHPHVYTLGRGASEHYLIAPPPGVPIHRVSRGGQVTYHGPGQLVGYPILKLEGAARDVHGYLRALETAIIQTLALHGLDAGRRDKLTGVWVGERKIASIGVGIRRWITLHGFALNVDSDLGFFDHIVPCGIHGCRMTSITRERRAAASEVVNSRHGVGVSAVAASMAERFASVFGYESTVKLSAAEIWRMADFASGNALEANCG